MERIMDGWKEKTAMREEWIVEGKKGSKMKIRRKDEKRMDGQTTGQTGRYEVLR